MLGRDVEAHEEQRVRISTIARQLLPWLCRPCEPIWGCGTVQRVLDMETSPWARHLMLRSAEALRQGKQAANQAGTRQPEQLIGIDMKPEPGLRVMLSLQARTHAVHARGKHSGGFVHDAGASGVGPHTRTSGELAREPSEHYFCAGTIVQVGRAAVAGQADAAVCPIGTVEVVWDNGFPGGFHLPLHPHATSCRPQVCNVGREGVFDLVLVRDQVLLGSSICPLALGLRVVLSRRELVNDELAFLDCGDGPGSVVQILGWQAPAPAEESLQVRDVETGDTRLASAGPDTRDTHSRDADSDESASPRSDTAQSQLRSRRSAPLVPKLVLAGAHSVTSQAHSVTSQRAPSQSHSERAGTQGHSALGAKDVQGANECAEEPGAPCAPPVTGQVVVKWDKTGNESIYKCGVDGQFCLALWQSGANWKGHMCEVLWDATGITWALPYELGFEYRHIVDGLETRQEQGVSNRIQPLVLVEQRPNVQQIVLDLVDQACQLVEHEHATRQKAATLMQKLARGVWGRRRIRRLRVLSSSREVMREHGSGQRLDLARLLKRRLAFPPFSFQWRLVVLLHRLQEVRSDANESSSQAATQAVTVLPPHLEAHSGIVQREVKEKILDCLRVLADDSLHANDKLQTLVSFTAIITHHDARHQRCLQDAAVEEGLIPFLLEAVMGIVASEAPENENGKVKGAWAEILTSSASSVDLTRELEQAVEALQHGAALAIAQLALQNRRACQALVECGCMQVVALLLEKTLHFHHYMQEALVGIINNVCACCPLAPPLTLQTCPGYLHDLVALLYPPHLQAQYEAEEDNEGDSSDGFDDAHHQHVDAHSNIPGKLLILDKRHSMELMRAVSKPFKVPRRAQQLHAASSTPTPLSSLQAVTVMALSSIACRDSASRKVLTSGGLVTVLETIMPRLTLLHEHGPRMYTPTKWSDDKGLPEDAIGAYLYLSVKPTTPHPHSLLPPPASGSVALSHFVGLILDSANDWLSCHTKVGGAGSVAEGAHGERTGPASDTRHSPAALQRMPSGSVQRVDSSGTGKGWDLLRRAPSIISIGKAFSRVGSEESKAVVKGWSMDVVTAVGRRGPLPLSRADPPLSFLSRHAVMLERERSKTGFGRTSSRASVGGSHASLSRAPSGGNVTRAPSFARAPSFGRVASCEVTKAMTDLQASAPKPAALAERGYVRLGSLPVPVFLATALLRLCAYPESRRAIIDGEGAQVLSKLFVCRHVGPCARRLLMEALLLLTLNVTSSSPLVPLLGVKDFRSQVGEGQLSDQLSDQDGADAPTRSEVLKAVIDTQLLELLRLDSALMTHLVSIQDDPTVLEHRAILGQLPANDPLPESEQGADAADAAVTRTQSGEALKIEEPSAPVILVPGAATLEEVHGGMDDWLKTLELCWPSQSVAGMLVWHASVLSDPVEACGKLQYLVRDAGHVMVTSACDAQHDAALLAAELATQNLVVWGQGDEQITGLSKQDRPVDADNKLIPIPVTLSLGVGAASALVVLWTARILENAMCMAQIAYARCLGKQVLVVERCSFGLWRRKSPEDHELSLQGASAAWRGSSSSSEGSRSRHGHGQAKVKHDALPQVNHDALPQVDDHHGRYLVVGPLQLGTFAESEQAPPSLISITNKACPVLWASVELGGRVKQKRKGDKLPHSAHEEGGSKGEGGASAAGRATDAVQVLDNENGHDNVPPKRMAVGFDEMAAARGMAKEVETAAAKETEQMLYELCAVAQRVSKRLGGIGMAPGVLAMRVTGHDARALILAQHAHSLSRAESTGPEGAQVRKNARGFPSADQAAQKNGSVERHGDSGHLAAADVHVVHDDQAPNADELCFIADLCRAAGLQEEQMVVLGVLGSEDDVCVCVALLHLSVGKSVGKFCP